MARYTIDGREYPSVTEIISDCTDKSNALIPWAVKTDLAWVKNQLNQCKTPHWGRYKVSSKQLLYILREAKTAHRKVSDEALSVGSEVHDLIERSCKAIIEGNKLEDTCSDLVLNDREQVRNAFYAFCDWYKANNIQPIAIEERVIGDCWAGTLDFRGYYNGKLYVIDWKTSKGFYHDQYGPQIAAYRSVSGEDVEGCGVLRIDKETGIPEWKDYSSRYKRDIKTYNCMVALYMQRHPRIAKKAGWRG